MVNFHQCILSMPLDEEGNDGDDGEKEFEPTVDMLMNEFDDEKTLEEEEALDDQENEGN